MFFKVKKKGILMFNAFHGHENERPESTDFQGSDILKILG